MIVDASAILAILLDEPEALGFITAIGRAPRPRTSAASYLEAAIRVDRSGDPVAGRLLDDLLTRLGITIEPVSVAQARLARAAYRTFGKGSGHRAGLNFGDCLTCALAKDAAEPLLLKGDDFIHTDLAAALGAGGSAEDAP